MTRTRIKFLGLAEMALHGARYSNLSHRRGYCTEIQQPPWGWLLHILCARDKRGDVPVWTATLRLSVALSAAALHSTPRREMRTPCGILGFGVVKNRPCCRLGLLRSFGRSCHKSSSRAPEHIQAQQRLAAARGAHGDPPMGTTRGNSLGIPSEERLRDLDATCAALLVQHHEHCLAR